MGMAQKILKKPSESEKRKIQSYMTNLLFLSQEAERDDLSWISEICENALTHLASHASKSSFEATELLDASLCEALQFLIAFLALPARSRKEIVRHVSRYEEHRKPGPAKAGQKKVSSVAVGGSPERKRDNRRTKHCHYCRRAHSPTARKKEAAIIHRSMNAEKDNFLACDVESYLNDKPKAHVNGETESV